MADNRFFKKSGPFTLSEIATKAECKLQEGVDGNIKINDIRGVDDAAEGDLTWAFIPAVRDDLTKTKATAVITSEKFAKYVPTGVAVLLSNDPHRSYGLAAQMFYPNEFESEISNKANIDSTAKLGEGCRVEAGAFIGKNVELGNACWIQANAVIQDGVKMGDNCIVGSNACVSHCIAGNKVYIYPGAMIGQDGFGFAMGVLGPTKVPQLGRVIIGNDVEIGSNTTVDRGAMGDTVIGDGCRIDNLCQIAHNVKLGSCCVIVAQVGIAGSCEFGDYVVAGGQSGFAGHLKICSMTQVGAQSGVMNDVKEPGQILMGAPAIPHMDFMRQNVLLKKMVKDSKKEPSNDKKD